MTSTKRTRPQLKDLPGGQLTELVVVVVMALAIAFVVQLLLIKPYKIPSGSMEPTLDIGQRVLVNRLSTRLGSKSEIGDVVTFHPPQGADAQICGTERRADQPCPRANPRQDRQTFIKRVVGLGGDRIAVRGGHVVRNGKLQSEPFTADCGGTDVCDFPRAITIPKGYVFLMGDNRGQSDDARYWGPIPESWVIGKAFATYWPPGRIGGL